MKNSRTNGQTSCSVIAYAIPEDKRRTKVHKILLGYGKWTQYSLFECFLSRKDLLQLQAKLEPHLVEAEDRVRFYPLCAMGVRKVETVGGLPPAEDILFVIESVSKSAGLPNSGSEQRPALRPTSGRNNNEDRS